MTSSISTTVATPSRLRRFGLRTHLCVHNLQLPRRIVRLRIRRTDESDQTRAEEHLDDARCSLIGCMLAFGRYISSCTAITRPSNYHHPARQALPVIIDTDVDADAAKANDHHGGQRPDTAATPTLRMDLAERVAVQNRVPLLVADSDTAEVLVKVAALGVSCVILQEAAVQAAQSVPYWQSAGRDLLTSKSGWRFPGAMAGGMLGGCG